MADAAPYTEGAFRVGGIENFVPPPGQEHKLRISTRTDPNSYAGDVQTRTFRRPVTLRAYERFCWDLDAPHLFLAPDQVVLLDVMDFMGVLLDGSVDVFWTSPPFNLKDKLRGGNSTKTGIRRQYAEADTGRGDGTWRPEPVYQQGQVQFLRECYRALHADGFMFYSHKVRLVQGVAVNPRSWIDKTDFFVHQELIWYRRGTAQNSPTRFYPNYETIYVLAKRPAVNTKQYGKGLRLVNRGRKSGGEGLGDVFDLKGNHHDRSETGHECPTPEEIVRRCLSVIPNRAGKLVVDPYGGSGTTGVVAKRLDMRYLLNDRAEKYVRLMKERGL